ncbi:MAG TPA: hypothetical protein VGN36_09090, partial [Sphingorhabdus sp.]|nr:hypothetical protein [Sphingorhabdus sp.]
MTTDDLKTPTARTALLCYLGLWAASTAYLGASGADWTFPVISLVLFGTILSGVAWLLTRNIMPAEIPVADAKRESLGLLVYTALYAFILIGFGLGAIKDGIAGGPLQEVAVLVYKLAIHVALPAAIVLMLGGAVRPLFTAIVGGRRWWIALIALSVIFFALLAAVSPSLEQIAALGLAPVFVVLAVLASWAWVSVEAGLSEEFLFRAVLQTRIAIWLRSPATA